MFPYAFRHSFAKRHADAGVPIDVLAELMDHDSFQTTRIYYRVKEVRLREAVERVTRMQFDRHGTRIWGAVTSVLDAERTRRAIGAVVVPFGTCSEPSNVAAGGGACPPLPLRGLRPLLHRRLLPPRPAHLPRRPAAAAREA
ncbi:tyrosine-type recombinase/integrase [Streptomyces sp. MS1.AVA.3]|uniref:tyrosine-type recombinase/integrase n=1 Tax=Streptomyces decoyicus TaxID=249567 RepID=UPI0030BEC1E5